MALASGKGSTLEFFCKKQQEGQACFYIQAIITNNPKAGVLDVAKKFSIPYHVINYDTPELADQKLYELLSSYESQLIVLAGFLKKVGLKVLKKFSNQMINSHPSLLPAFGGLGFYGLKVHTAVLSAGVPETGISIHLLNEDYDRGRILAQKKIPIVNIKTPEELQKKVKQLEKVFYFETIQKILKKEIPLNPES